MDVTVNGAYKNHLKEAFTDWYAQRVADAIRGHDDDFEAAVTSLQPDLRLFILKPLHARWTMDTHATVAAKEGLIVAGWEKTGLLAAVQAASQSSPCTSGTSATISLSKKDQKDKSLPMPSSSMFFSAVTEAWHGKLYEEHYLPANLCQSRLDGLNGSNACTVIATQVATKVLQGLLPLPDPGEALQQKK